MGPLNSSLSKIPLGVRHESKYSGMITYSGKKDTGRVLLVQQIFTELLNVSGSDYPAVDRTVLGCAFWSTRSLCSIVSLSLSLKFQEFHKLRLTFGFTALPFLLCWILTPLQTQEVCYGVLTTSNYPSVSDPTIAGWIPGLFQLALKTFHLL